MRIEISDFVMRTFVLYAGNIARRHFRKHLARDDAVGLGMGQMMAGTMAQTMAGVAQPAAAAAPAAAPVEDFTAKLAKLKVMLDQNLITQADYDTAKAEVLKKMLG